MIYRQLIKFRKFIQLLVGLPKLSLNCNIISSCVTKNSVDIVRFIICHIPIFRMNGLHTKFNNNNKLQHKNKLENTKISNPKVNN